MLPALLLCCLYVAASLTVLGCADGGCNRGQVTGTLEKGRRELPKPSISGKWDEGLWAEMEDGSRVELWRPAPPPPDPTRSTDSQHMSLVAAACSSSPRLCVSCEGVNQLLNGSTRMPVVLTLMRTCSSLLLRLGAVIQGHLGHRQTAIRSCRYNFTSWAIQLNEITPGLERKLAPTDCRLRPDQHYTELGEYDKVRLWDSPHQHRLLPTAACTALCPRTVCNGRSTKHLCCG